MLGLRRRNKSRRKGVSPLVAGILVIGITIPLVLEGFTQVQPVLQPERGHGVRRDLEQPEGGLLRRSRRGRERRPGREPRAPARRHDQDRARDRGARLAGPRGRRGQDPPAAVHRGHGVRRGQPRLALLPDPARRGRGHPDQPDRRPGAVRPGAHRASGRHAREPSHAARRVLDQRPQGRRSARATTAPSATGSRPTAPPRWPTRPRSARASTTSPTACCAARRRPSRRSPPTSSR